jgi:hypothetical protein
MSSRKSFLSRHRLGKFKTIYIFKLLIMDRNGFVLYCRISGVESLLVWSLLRPIEVSISSDIDMAGTSANNHTLTIHSSPSCSTPTDTVLLSLLLQLIQSFLLTLPALIPSFYLLLLQLVQSFLLTLPTLI